MHYHENLTIKSNEELNLLLKCLIWFPFSTYSFAWPCLATMRLKNSFSNSIESEYSWGSGSNNFKVFCIQHLPIHTYDFSAASRKDLLEMAESETLLEQIIRQAQHILLRQRVAFVLDTMARDLKDPLISCHWGTITSPTRTSVKVCITTSGYDAIIRCGQ